MTVLATVQARIARLSASLRSPSGRPAAPRQNRSYKVRRCDECHRPRALSRYEGQDATCRQCVTELATPAARRLVVTRPNRVAMIARDPEAIARNAELLRRLCRESPD